LQVAAGNSGAACCALQNALLEILARVDAQVDFSAVDMVTVCGGQ
jgi:hypothetical protein